MTLSAYEQRTLCGIESDCHRDDPGFAHRMDFGVAANRQRRALAMARTTVWIGVLAIVIGSAAARGVMSIGAVIACYGAVTVTVGTVNWLRLRTPSVRTHRDRRRP